MLSLLTSQLRKGSFRRRNNNEYPTFNSHLFTRPRFERDYPLNLSILISGGKEINRDSLSKGD